jgi:hypothetical protein
MKMKLLSPIPYLALLLAAGCGTLSKGTPDNPSPYGGVTATGELKTPDRVLYDADFAIATAYDGLHAFVKWEYDNRQALSGTPEIKQAADKIRAGASDWFKSAIAVRDSYAGNPTTETRSALQKALDTLQAAIAEANRYRTAQLTTDH